MATRSTIDRTTDHICAGLAADIAYYAVRGRSYFRCVGPHWGEIAIPVQYAQFSMICADCRIECTEESDAGEARCNYCGEVL